MGTATADEIAALDDGAAALAKAANELMAKADAIDAAVYDLKAVNPNAKATEDTRTPEELLDLIDAKGIEVAEALSALRASLKRGPIDPVGFERHGGPRSQARAPVRPPSP
jgi:type I restriction enzyme M protein